MSEGNCELLRLVHMCHVNTSASHIQTQTQAECDMHVHFRSQDGGNLVPRVRVTLDQQSGNGGGCHLGLNVNCKGMEQVVFILCLHLPLRCLVHTCEMQTQVQAQGNDKFPFLALAVALAFAFGLW